MTWVERGGQKIELFAYGATFTEQPLDLTSGAVRMLENDHAMIHEGRTFSIQRSVESLGNGANLDILFITPNTTDQVHLIWDVYGGGKHTVSVTENIIVTCGTALTPYNWNRQSATAPASTVTHTPTGTVGGTAIYTRTFGAGKESISSRSFGERILARNMPYLFRVQSGAAGIDVSVELQWYAYTPKVTA